jgi:hypothetical protein
MNFRHHPAKPLTGSPTPEPVPNWSKLSRADEVEIHGHGQAITSGRIDMLALDGSVLWLQQNESGFSKTRERAARYFYIAMACVFTDDPQTATTRTGL